MAHLRVRRYRMLAAVVTTGALAVVAFPGRATSVQAQSCSLPSCVQPSSMGGGAVQATIQFSPLFPAFNQQTCSQIGFTFNALLAGAAVNTIGSQFAGTAPETGSGGDTCGLPSEELTGTSFTINPFTDVFPILNLGTMTLACPTGLGGVGKGFYNRIGTTMVIEAGGSCNINQTIDTTLQFISVGEFAPGVPSTVPAPSNPLIPTGDQWQGTNGQVSNGVFYGEWDFLLSN